MGETHLYDGGDKGSRTPDLLNAIETLYQLSYIPKKENACMLSKYRDECKRFLLKFLKELKWLHVVYFWA